MNLYRLQLRDEYDWCVFVFAESRNKAKMAVVNYFTYDGEPYIDWNCQTVTKDVGGKEEVCDGNCKRLSDLGIEYENNDI